MEIKLGPNKFYIGESETQNICEITWEEKDNVLYVLHTFVDPSLRGQDIGLKLIEKVIEYAKLNNKKIKPVCPYVVKMFDRNPSWSYIKEN